MSGWTPAHRYRRKRKTDPLKSTPEWIGFRDQRNNARTRKIQFDLTFEQWCLIWKQSGKFHLRGFKKGCFVMARKGDVGSYSVGNVMIIPHEKNSGDGALGKPKPKSEQWRKQHSIFMRRRAAGKQPIWGEP